MPEDILSYIKTIQYQNCETTWQIAKGYLHACVSNSGSKFSSSASDEETAKFLKFSKKVDAFIEEVEGYELHIIKF